MIPNELIDQILDKTDIVEVVSAYVPLKRAGQNFKACCPFHEEKTPSFVVSAPKQIYHCFGCGAGGNAISFLMKHEHMDFIESIKMLADKTGIALPRSTQADKAKNTLAEKLYGANNLACNLYQENLVGDDGKEAYRYFTRRGITEETIKQFRLGFAKDAWQALMHHSREKGLEQENLERAGLILQNTASGNWYDRFRNRIVFPIFDIRSRVLGFGARALDNKLPKYINSPETYIYTKGRHLYGLNFAKDQIRKQNYVIIVEGYFDLILPFQNGVKNIVATLGTALTPDQINAIRRFTRNVVMIYDSDKAGEGATLRSFELLIEEEMNIRIAILPTGSDPDSFVRKEGRDGFMKILKASKDLFDYKLGTLTAKYKKAEPRGKTRIVSEMLPTLAKIKNAVLRSSYLKRMSEILAVDEESIRSELQKTKTGFRKSTNEARPAPQPEKKGENLAELTLLAIAMEGDDSIEKIEKELGLANFKSESFASIFEKIGELHKNGKKITPAHLISHFTDDNRERIVSEAANIGQTIRDKGRVLKDCLKHIKKDNLKQALSGMQFKIKEAEGAHDLEMVNKLIAEYNDLIKKRI